VPEDEPDEEPEEDPELDDDPDEEPDDDELEDAPEDEPDVVPEEVPDEDPELLPPTGDGVGPESGAPLLGPVGEGSCTPPEEAWAAVAASPVSPNPLVSPASLEVGDSPPVLTRTEQPVAATRTTSTPRPRALPPRRTLRTEGRYFTTQSRVAGAGGAAMPDGKIEGTR
jgi:hypothetical protein